MPNKTVEEQLLEMRNALSIIRMLSNVPKEPVANNNYRVGDIVLKGYGKTAKVVVITKIEVDPSPMHTVHYEVKTLKNRKLRVAFWQLQDINNARAKIMKRITADSQLVSNLDQNLKKMQERQSGV